jgi:predicted DCC family thiol-disulfide oxidoreductase YuxK
VSEWDVEVFFDGACPLCAREARLLRALDRRRRVRMTDIASPAFSADTVGVPWERLMARIHGRLPDGTLLEGVEVFRRLYGAVGLRWLVAATRLPGIAALLDAAYELYARNRLRLTDRCDRACTTRS